MYDYRFAVKVAVTDYIRDNYDADAIAIDGKPENMTIIQSSLKLDQAEQPYGEFVDKVFTVYRPATIDAENIEINCGARDCATCRRCYFDKTIKDIREKLK